MNHVIESSIQEEIYDPVCLALEAQGVETFDSWLFDQPLLGIKNGTKIVVGSTDIVYRMLDDETVLLVLYRKEKTDRLTLAFSFSALFWFIRFLTQHATEVKVITGLVDVFPYLSDRGICSDRLSEFYSRCGAEEIYVDGLRWVRLELKKFTPMR